MKKRRNAYTSIHNADELKQIIEEETKNGYKIVRFIDMYENIEFEEDSDSYITKPSAFRINWIKSIVDAKDYIIEVNLKYERKINPYSEAETIEKTITIYTGTLLVLWFEK